MGTAATTQDVLQWLHLICVKMRLDSKQACGMVSGRRSLPRAARRQGWPHWQQCHKFIKREEVLTQHRPAQQLESMEVMQVRHKARSMSHLNRDFEGRPHHMRHLLSQQGCWHWPCAELAGNVAQQSGLAIQ